MAAGVRHWQTFSFDLFRVNPPLVRLWATLPVVFLGPQTDWSEFRDFVGTRPEFDEGAAFVAVNTDRWHVYFLVARLACIPLSLIGAIVSFRWAAELYGWWSGFVALILWCGCPEILAHGQMITPDVGAAAFGILACYSFWHWLQMPTLRSTVFAGAALGLAELVKTTWLILFVVFPIVWIIHHFATRRESLQRQPANHLAAASWMSVLQLAFILLLGMYVINVGYGFVRTGESLGSFPFVSDSLGGNTASDERAVHGSNRFRESWLGFIPVPLPADYVLGVDIQKSDLERPHDCYVAGQWTDTGWWLFYVYGSLIKTPIGTLVLFAAATVTCCAIRTSGARWLDELALLLPPAALLLLVSSQTRMNSHLRYVLPAIPFLLIWSSRLATNRAAGQTARATFVAAVVAWSVASSLLVFPHSHSYFNEIVGGPLNGPAYLLDSSTDWGQDLLGLKQWLDRHPEARPLGVAHVGSLDARFLGLEAVALPRCDAKLRESSGPQPGWYAVSVNCLRGRSRDFAYFLRFRPVATIGYSMHIYHLTHDEVKAVREELGLPTLD